ncbi:hypothetical protein [Dickeya fangzhongdai]|uniref:hypothetical protein n=1 Tax=Dickeya fangzhongdai TaxID=1778540 RepID=UPI0026E10305|nr:hypothetical protein [Dickeya fangzhongdai]WKV50918.1 hypothetical protein PL145_01140 [Dickeya fangzhongdai]
MLRRAGACLTGAPLRLDDDGGFLEFIAWLVEPCRSEPEARFFYLFGWSLKGMAAISSSFFLAMVSPPHRFIIYYNSCPLFQPLIIFCVQEPLPAVDTI